MQVHQLGRGFVANALAAAADMDLGAQFQEAGSHRLAEPGTTPGDQDAPTGEKLILEHRFHPAGLSVGRLTKSGQFPSVKRQPGKSVREHFMEDRVSITISDGVADVRLVRADKMNALDAAMFEALVAATARLGGEKGLRAVVLSGEGRAFCAGLDMGRFAAMKESGGSGLGGGGKRDLSVRTHGLANFPQQAVWGWRQLPVPVIAAVHGVAFGGGFQLALGADMRFLAPDARLSIMEIKWGLVPDMAGTPILASLVRDDILRELTYTGRIFSAEEAMRYGLATRICDDPRAAAFEVAREIAAKSPDAIRAAKRMLNNLQVDPGPALLAESVEQQRLLGSANQIEAVSANIDKRAPRFVDV
jgi:enoyl-CoA hydratase/carnithine racemase